MGCVSSKFMGMEVEREIISGVKGVYHELDHVVSLTSTTYGALKLDEDEDSKKEEEEEEKTEVINAWELMGDLEEEETLPVSVGSPKSKLGRSPFKRLNNKLGKSPRKLSNLSAGKENKCKSSSFRNSEDEEARMKKMIASQSPISCSKRVSAKVIDEFMSKCPPGGENSVVVYTTTLRGIRKTFEECNVVRSILELHQIEMYERDVSMDSGFKEELRKLLMEFGGFRIPVVFVKGKLIGGANEISNLEEQGKLGILLNQMKIPKKNSSCVCEACGGVRFILCCHCNGSRKVLVDDLKDTVRCGECNENGLIHCPLCS